MVSFFHPTLKSMNKEGLFGAEEQKQAEQIT